MMEKINFKVAETERKMIQDTIPSFILRVEEQLKSMNADSKTSTGSITFELQKIHSMLDENDKKIGKLDKSLKYQDSHITEHKNQILKLEDHVIECYDSLSTYGQRMKVHTQALNNIVASVTMIRSDITDVHNELESRYLILVSMQQASERTMLQTTRGAIDNLTEMIESTGKAGQQEGNVSQRRIQQFQDDMARMRTELLAAQTLQSSELRSEIQKNGTEVDEKMKVLELQVDQKVKKTDEARAAGDADLQQKLQASEEERKKNDAAMEEKLKKSEEERKKAEADLEERLKTKPPADDDDASQKKKATNVDEETVQQVKRDISGTLLYVSVC
jgi:chromosome segregation ATPase